MTSVRRYSLSFCCGRCNGSLHSFERLAKLLCAQEPIRTIPNLMMDRSVLAVPCAEKCQSDSVWTDLNYCRNTGNEMLRCVAQIVEFYKTHGNISQPCRIANFLLAIARSQIIVLLQVFWQSLPGRNHAYAHRLQVNGKHSYHIGMTITRQG